MSDITPEDFLYQTKTAYLDYMSNYVDRLKIINIDDNEHRKIGSLGICVHIFDQWFSRYDENGDAPTDDDNMFDEEFFYSTLRIFNNLLGVDFWIEL
jgi:hypothetical protein